MATSFATAPARSTRRIVLDTPTVATPTRSGRHRCGRRRRPDRQHDHPQCQQPRTKLWPAATMGNRFSRRFGHRATARSRRHRAARWRWQVVATTRATQPEPRRHRGLPAGSVLGHGCRRQFEQRGNAAPRAVAAKGLLGCWCRTDCRSCTLGRRSCDCTVVTAQL